MDTEAFIRDCAARDWSKHMTYSALGMSHQKFESILEILDPPVKFVQGSKSIDVRFSNARKGVYTDKRKAALNKAKQVRLDGLRRLEICGIMGTGRELYRLWQEHIGVSYSTVARRLQEGQDIYDAFFLNRQKDCTGYAKVF